MLLQIPDVLSPELIVQCRAALEAADWVDGKVTAGYASARTKHNRQLPEDHPLAQHIGELILKALSQNALFMAAALPLKVFPPLFNAYSGGERFGAHIDNAIRDHRASGQRIRTDLSCTLFFSEPDSYQGGELVIEDTYGSHAVKLPAGDLVLYPATSLHHVRPVTHGTRLCSFFWLQSLVRDDGQRHLLLDLDSSIQALHRDHPEHPAHSQLLGVYHNLLRRWADT